MQCPKCSYEPTMSEIQASPDKCPRCDVYYSKIGAEHAAAKARKPTLGSARKIVPLLLLLVAIGGGATGWIKYQARQAALKDIESQVRLASAYVDQMVSSADGAQAITFREIFANADRYVSEIDAALVKVSIVEPKIAEVEPAQRYMRGSQEMIRNISGQARAVLEFSNAKDKEKRGEEQSRSSNSYIRDQATETRLEAYDEQLKALDSMKERKAAIKKVAENLMGAQKELEAFNQTAFIRPGLVEKIVQAE